MSGWSIDVGSWRINMWKKPLSLRPAGFRAGGEAADLDKLSTPSHTALHKQDRKAWSCWNVCRTDAKDVQALVQFILLHLRAAIHDCSWPARYNKCVLQITCKEAANYLGGNPKGGQEWHSVCLHVCKVTSDRKNSAPNGHEMQNKKVTEKWKIR